PWPGNPTPWPRAQNPAASSIKSRAGPDPSPLHHCGARICTQVIAELRRTIDAPQGKIRDLTHFECAYLCLHAECLGGIARYPAHGFLRREPKQGAGHVEREQQG